MKKGCIRGVPGVDFSLIAGKAGSITYMGDSPWGVSSQGDGKSTWGDWLSGVWVSLNIAVPSRLKAAMGSLSTEGRAEGAVACFYGSVSLACPQRSVACWAAGSDWQLRTK